jgi:hypothetical protein
MEYGDGDVVKWAVLILVGVGATLRGVVLIDIGKG